MTGVIFDPRGELGQPQARDHEAPNAHEYREGAQTLGIENFGQHPRALVPVALELDSPDKRQQAEFVQPCKRVRVLTHHRDVPLSEI